MTLLLSLPNPAANAAGPFAWSLLLAAAVVVLSVVPLGIGRSKADFSLTDLQAPRAMFDRLPAWGKRASWAHQNCFEAFTLHAPAALLCVIAPPSAAIAVAAAWLHPLLRALYIGAYVANVAPLRGLCWALGLACTGVLYVQGLTTLLNGAG
ncbi:MAG: hypothetical protein RLZZ624_731 [Cyanobacteriota bacterium]|jgi:uncharacterized MAPEG superfamily protein